jgi:hypothetical protein
MAFLPASLLIAAGRAEAGGAPNSESLVAA